MDSFVLILFAMAAGLTASGIVANLYRLSGAQATTSRERTIRLVVMVVAGPSVLFDKAVRGLISREWNSGTFWFATIGVAYWSLMLGLFIISVALALTAE